METKSYRRFGVEVELQSVPVLDSWEAVQCSAPLGSTSSDDDVNPVPLVNGDLKVSQDFLKKIREVWRAVPTKYGVTSMAPTIYKVPMELQRGNGEAYEPVSVRIGAMWPLYEDLFGNSSCDLNTRKLQVYKWCCVQQLIGRHSSLSEEARIPELLTRCLQSLKCRESRIRASYSEDIAIPADRSDDLALTMLLDGCFILRLLLKYNHLAKREADHGHGSGGGQVDDHDYRTQMFGRCSVWELVKRDMLLLQNQVPFFVLKVLFQQLNSEPDESDSVLVDGALRLFRHLHPQRLDPAPIKCDRVHHLLHLFYHSIDLPAEAKPTDRTHQRVLLSELPQWVPCAKELEEAGVRFRRRKDAKSFMDIRFVGGVLEIPQLQLYDYSEAMFRNLIAFEQTYPDTRLHVTTYAAFMHCLLKTPVDSGILHLRGILVNQINDDRDATSFFNRICAQVHWPTDNYLVDLIDKVNKYKDSKWHKWHASLVRGYFSSPWAAISLLAAVILLAMTMLQTFFSVYGYFKPRK